MTRLLVAMDESPESLHAARMAAQLFPGADTEFLVINVARLPTLWAGGGVFGEVTYASPELWTDLAEDIERNEREELAAEAAEAGLAGADVLVETGDPVSVICRAAEEHGADIIVVGRHSKGFLARLLEPSVADGVVHHTATPVLVVPGVS